MYSRYRKIIWSTWKKKLSPKMQFKFRHVLCIGHRFNRFMSVQKIYWIFNKVQKLRIFKVGVFWITGKNTCQKKYMVKLVIIELKNGLMVHVWWWLMMCGNRTKNSGWSWIECVCYTQFEIWCINLIVLHTSIIFTSAILCIEVLNRMG